MIRYRESPSQQSIKVTKLGREAVRKTTLASANSSSRKKDTQGAGIAPSSLLAQVRATAAWALGADKPVATTRKLYPWEKLAPVIKGRASKKPGGLPAGILLQPEAADIAWCANPHAPEYLRYLLSAHYMTVGTFCPTDVDQRIRVHYWASLPREYMNDALSCAFEAATWPILPVSARVVHVGEEALSGHHGEWLSVVAGALGRALALDDNRAVARCEAFIDTELAREANAFARAAKAGEPGTMLCLATTIAHNLGDLSRVVETWKPALRACAERYHRLGFTEDGAFGKAFVLAGELNKAMMALENHRFLALREARVLRQSRSWLLPFGPYLNGWGEMLGSCTEFDERERAEILAGLLVTHGRRRTEQGVLRAIAGMNQVVPGGVLALAPHLEANVRSLLLSGGVQQALRVSEPQFQRVWNARFEAWRNANVSALRSLRVR
jgi:hypothetical protein